MEEMPIVPIAETTAPPGNGPPENTKTPGGPDGSGPPKGMFFAESFPYLFTLIVGFINFQYNQIIDNLKDAPLVEYAVNATASKDTLGGTLTHYTCELTNISNKISFKSLAVIFEFETEQRETKTIFDPVMVAHHPAAPYESQSMDIADSSGVFFNVIKFQPGTAYQLSFSTLESNKRTVGDTVKQAPAAQESWHAPPFIYGKSEDTLLLKESSALTFFIKHQLVINFVILILLIAILLSYYIYLNRKQYHG